MSPLISPSHQHIDYTLGFIVLLGLSSALVFPLSLSFFPQLMGLIGCSVLYFRNRKIERPDWKTVAIFLAISGLIAVSTIWAVEPAKIWPRIYKVSAGLILFIPFLILIRDMPVQAVRIFQKYCFIPFFVCGAFILSELVFNFPILSFIKERNLEAWELNKHITSYILLVPFAVYVLLTSGQKNIALALLGLSAAILVVTDSQASQLAGIVSVVTYLGYRFIPRLMLRLCLMAALLALFAMPWISTAFYDLVADKVGDEGVLRQACASQRLEIWDFVSRKIMENPWTGFGVDASRYLTFESRMVYFKENNILHPHNMPLQLWIEFGIIGFMFTTGLLYFVYQSLVKLSDKVQMLPVIVFSSAFIVLMVSWSIWSSWLIGLLLLLFAFSKMSCREDLQE